MIEISAREFLGQLFDLFLEKLFFEFLGPKSCSQMSGAVVFDCDSCVGMYSFFCGFDVDVGLERFFELLLLFQVLPQGLFLMPWGPIFGPFCLFSFHHFQSSVSFSAPVASSAYQI